MRAAYFIPTSVSAAGCAHWAGVPESASVRVSSLSAGTGELLAALRSYLADLEGVLVIEPPSFGLPPRQLDLRCIAFRPEVEAFAVRIRTLIAAG